MNLDQQKIKSTLGKTSADDNGSQVLESDEPVYDFDEISEEVAAVYRNKYTLASCDALYIKDERNIFLFEFKNARKSRIGWKQLHCKAYDSVWTLQTSIFPHLSLNELRERLTMFVIYNDDGVVEREQESPAFDALKAKMAGLADGSDEILFRLEIFKGFLYKNIFTVEKDTYMKEYHRQIFSAQCQ